ncbi:restriction endonuclease subunit S [Streptococcus mutans]|uniref:restriction endonuclease subunit S n=2 Tax=Streptococcus mutans TaxID=1309 RepID=UPI00034D41AF|nr:restriction endonuclease subunit S [Streptococcus mutans]MCB4926352.1 restriction endonuclease subunit S [Streptococcus mutans]MCB4937625.1 restriction endonuclease subunit S [Streptococcus mutans]MCB4946280.1 restriction endonuclease subunit S [Streptococcus mutans]MCB5042261.1 restriction endonuclease subunit S [Streptococcus mutans]MCB5046135.1 restriction endonuclease subunit S [Streptococcus mutans]
MTRKMKDSGVEWIGEIPEDWSVSRLKNVLKERNEKNSPIKTREVLSLMKNGGVIPYSEKGNIGNRAKEDVSLYKLVYTNDIVLNSMNIIIGSVGKSNYFGAVSPVYYTLYPRYEQYNVDYYNYVFQTKEFQNNLKGIGNGILEHRMRIQMSKLNNVQLPILSSLEQQKIVDILDDKVGRIDQIILETQQSIEELKKYKQSVITEAVTKGLDKKAKMKDSGIEWIGEVPIDSKIVRIKNYFTLKGRIGWQGLTSAEYIGEGPYLITGVDFANGEIDWSKSVHISEKRYEEAPEIHIKEGDLLITKDGTVGKVAITKNTPQKVSLNSGVMLIREKSDNSLNKRFVYYALLSDIFWKWFNLSNIGASTINHLYQGQFYNFSFPLMTIEKQNEIVLYLDYKTKIIDSLISTKEQIINSYEQYKKSLIYEYVTGKKEVE